jgi:AcrR family transcriptional regulator
MDEARPEGASAAAPDAGARRERPREDRRARRRRELHARIFETARRLFLERGFEETRVEEIAEAADIAQATFFNHFPSKEAVLREMAEEVFERFRRLVREQAGHDAPTAERLHRFGERGAAVVERAPELTRRVLLSILHGADPARTESEVGSMQREVVALLRAGQGRGEVDPAADPELLAEIVLSVVTGAISRWIHDAGYPLRERLPRALDFVARAMAPE